MRAFASISLVSAAERTHGCRSVPGKGGEWPDLYLGTVSTESAQTPSRQAGDSSTDASQDRRSYLPYRRENEHAGGCVSMTQSVFQVCTGTVTTHEDVVLPGTH